MKMPARLLTRRKTNLSHIDGRNIAIPGNGIQEFFSFNSLHALTITLSGNAAAYLPSAIANGLPSDV